MSTKAPSVDGRINRSVDMAKKHPTLSVPEAMVLGGFSQKVITRDNAFGRNLYQQVCERLGKRRRTRGASPMRSPAPPPGWVALDSPQSIASSMTSLSQSVAASSTTAPTRKRSDQLAKEHAAAAKDRRLKKDAHKRATILFAKEKEQTAKALKNKALKKGKSAMEVK